MTDSSMVDTINNEDEIHYCEVHPDKETELRCNKCDRYMCGQCAVSTPVGYRCKQCVRQVEDTFFEGTQNDYLVAFAVVTGLTAVIATVVVWIGSAFWPLAFFAGLIAAGAISEAALRAIGRRRGRQTGEVVAGGAVVGGLIGWFVYGNLSYPSEYGQIVDMFSAVGQVVPREFTRMGYMTDLSILLPAVVFTGITAYLVYSRMKS